MMKIIKKIKSSKALVTLVWVLGILVIWETFAFVVAATKRMEVILVRSFISPDITPPKEAYGVLLKE